MFGKLEARTIFFLVLFGLAAGYSVAAFGSAQGGHGALSVHWRETSRVLILLVSVIGLIFLPARQALPKLNLALLIPFLILLAWATFMVLNAKYEVIKGEWVLHAHHGRFWESAPGSFSRKTSLGYTYELVSLLAFVFMIARSVESKSWRPLLACFAVLGTLVAVVGMGHRVLGIESVWAIDSTNKPTTFFAPYVYGANAGSFMNLTMLVSVALALGSWRKGEAKMSYFWIVCTALAVIGVVYSASKAGVLLLGLQSIAYVIWERKQIWEMIRSSGSSFTAISLEKKAAIGAGSLVFLFFLLAGADHLITRVDDFLGNMDKNGQASTVEGRFELIELMWRMSTAPGEGSWHGFGPGSFGQIMVWYLEEDYGVGRADFGHCDPLQTLVEWGYLGTACWFFIGGGAVVRGFYLLIKKRLSRSEEPLVKALCVALIGVGAHSFFDFPLSIFSIHLVAMGMCAVLWCLPGKRTLEDAEKDVHPA